jgi:hypothetical protein
MEPDDNNIEPNESQGHPAWQEILEVIPDNLHPLVRSGILR